MEIYADFREKVRINPKDVIEKLIDEEIGWGNWVFEKDNKFYLGYEVSAGSHSFDDDIETTQEKYEYVQALQLVLKHLNKKIF